VALETRLKAISKAEGIDLQRLRRQVSALAPNLEIYFKESWEVEPNYTVSVKWLLPGPLVLLDILQPVDVQNRWLLRDSRLSICMSRFEKGFPLSRDPLKISTFCTRYFISLLPRQPKRFYPRNDLRQISQIEPLGYHQITPEEMADLEAFLSCSNIVPVTDRAIKKAIAVRQGRKMRLASLAEQNRTLVARL
jgi:hypothetical protein